MSAIRFVDRATIIVKGGHGGKGCRSFYHDLWRRYPMSDGGDGGRGGHVIIRATPHQTTLLDFQTQRHFRGGDGTNGSSKKKHGANGKDSLLEVPCGTLVYDDETGELIRELMDTKDEVVLARGGAGGIGNAAKETIRYPSPKQRFDSARLEGSVGEDLRIRLELKLVADVGIIGMPNAGKSTLIGKISEAHPKIAPFPFTTLHPVLGAIRETDISAPFVAVDVPGLIRGAHKGRGLGLDFLRHIERTRLLVHLIDMAGFDMRDPVDDYKALREELEKYNKEVAEKPVLVVANKMDLPEAKKNLARFKKELKIIPIQISAQAGDGVEKLVEKITTRLGKMNKKIKK